MADLAYRFTIKEEAKNPITIEDIKAVRESLGTSSGTSEIKVMESQYLPDNVIMVPTNLYNQLKDNKL
jgi:hypothetical protein